MRRDAALLLMGEYAADQHGLITTAQAKELGVSDVALTRLARAGHLLKVGHGVYQLASAPDPSHLSLRVAWLRLDPQRPAWERHTPQTWGGTVSHSSAAQLHDLGDLPAERVELTTPVERTTRDASVLLHSAALDNDEVAVVEGLPVTTPLRTITDLLAARVDGGHIGGVIADAEQRGLIDLDTLAERITAKELEYGFVGKNGHQVIEDLVHQAQRRLGVQVRSEQMRDVAALSSMIGAAAGSLAHRFDLPYGEVVDALREIVAEQSNAFDVDTRAAREASDLRRFRNALAHMAIPSMNLGVMRNALASMQPSIDALTSDLRKSLEALPQIRPLPVPVKGPLPAAPLPDHDTHEQESTDAQDQIMGGGDR